MINYKCRSVAMEKNSSFYGFCPETLPIVAGEGAHVLDLVKGNEDIVLEVRPVFIPVKI